MTSTPWRSGRDFGCSRPSRLAVLKKASRNLPPKPPFNPLECSPEVVMSRECHRPLSIVDAGPVTGVRVASVRREQAAGDGDGDVSQHMQIVALSGFESRGGAFCGHSLQARFRDLSVHDT